MLRFIKFGFFVLLFGSCLISVACQTKEQKAAAAVKKCQTLLDQDDVQEASNCYAAAVAANPADGGEISQAGKIAVFKKCVDFNERKHYKQAIICFDGFTALEPDKASNYFLLGDSYYHYFKEGAKAGGQADKELLEKAAEAMEAGLKLKPEDATAHSLYGDILEGENDKQKSLAEHQTAVNLEPKTGIFWVKLGDIQVSLTQDEEAIKSYKQALNINPNDTLALYFLGLQYERMERLKDALETYEKALKIEPSDAEIGQKVRQLKDRIELQKQIIPPKSKAKKVGSPSGASDY